MKQILVIVLIALISCDKKSSENKNLNKKYFEFDKIEHYHTNLSIDSIVKSRSFPKTKKDFALLQIVDGNVPVNLNDTLFISNMKILQFEKQEINRKLHSKISNIFTERKSQSLVALDAASCITNFRDILIFRKSNKIIGVVKLCFTCDQYSIIGSKTNTTSFGERDEFKNLKEILVEPAANREPY